MGRRRDYQKYRRVSCNNCELREKEEISNGEGGRVKQSHFFCSSAFCPSAFFSLAFFFAISLPPSKYWK